MDFKLSEIESTSALWQKIEAELKNRLQILRERNDGELDPEATARLRGEIKAIKTMLAWSKTAPAIY